MTYAQLCARLRDAGIESAEWDALCLISHFCKTDPAIISADPSRDYASDALEGAASRRATRYPLQYLLGEWDFYRQSYEVSPDCLIPRADTEILVEEAVRALPTGSHFADLCTGSGCIAISVLAERPDTRALAVEKFPKTLALAQRNAHKNAVADRFVPLCADITHPHFLPSDAIFDAILSNPPYIRRDALKALAPELSAEPLAALDGGEDGLVFYRAILHHTPAHLKPGGFLLLEIGFDQAADLQRLAEQNGFTDFRVLRDYGGNDRVVRLQK